MDRDEPLTALRSATPSPGSVVAFTQGELWPPVKTAEGIAEIRQRKTGLSQRQRTMLLLVDGRRTVRQVKQIAVQAGAPDTCFDELLELGLIEVPEPVRPVPEPVQARAAEPAQPAQRIEPRSAANADEFASSENTYGNAESDWREPKAPVTRPAPTQPGVVDSLMSSLFPMVESVFGALGRANTDQPRDDALEEARRILMREVRGKAPIAGALTLVKLRRAKTREDMLALFDEIDSHLRTMMRQLSARQTLVHVRSLLERPS